MKSFVKGLRKQATTPHPLPLGKEFFVKNILLYRLILINALVLLWMVGTELQFGWFTKLLMADSTYVSWGIMGVFAALSGILLWKAIVTNRDFNVLIATESPTVEQWDSIEMKGSLREAEIDWFDRASAWLLFLGLIGTLLGLSMSLDGINTGSLGTPEGLKNVAVQMVAGLKTEISATVIGLVFSLWSEMNYVILRQTVIALADEEEVMMAVPYDGDYYDGGPDGGGEVIPFKRGA
jgi:hypothetical protein